MISGARAAAQPARPDWLPGRAGLAAWSGGQRPGAVAAGQALADQVAQVERGGAALEPGVVPGRPAVAELEPSSPPGGHPGPAERDGVPGRAGHRALLLADGEVINGEPALHRGLQRLGLDHRPVAGVVDRAAQVTGAVGGIAVPGQRLLPAAAAAAAAAAGAGGVRAGLPGRARGPGAITGRLGG